MATTTTNRINEFTPKKNGKVNKSECVRRMLKTSVDKLDTPNKDIIKMVKEHFGVDVTLSDVQNVKAQLRKEVKRIIRKAPKSVVNGIHEAMAIPIAANIVKPLPEPKNNAVEQVRLARLLVQAAGSKEAAKEMIDVV